jgi:hypothetical protein
MTTAIPISVSLIHLDKLMLIEKEVSLQRHSGANGVA